MALNALKAPMAPKALKAPEAPKALKVSYTRISYKSLYSIIVMTTRYNIKNKNNKVSIYFKGSDLEDIQILLENTHIQVHSEDSYKNITEYIERFVTKSEFLCRGLNPDYIRDSFNKVDAAIVLGSDMNILPNGNLYGFALVIFDEANNSLYADVICSHIGIQGAGDALIVAMENICKELLITKIVLKSVKSAIPFYEKYGFLKRNTMCNNMCVMTKQIQQHGKSESKRSKSKSKRSQSQSKRSQSQSKRSDSKSKRSKSKTLKKGLFNI